MIHAFAAEGVRKIASVLSSVASWFEEANLSFSPPEAPAEWTAPGSPPSGDLGEPDADPIDLADDDLLRALMA